MGVGLAVLGISGPIIYIPILPELITIMNEKNRYIKDDPKLMDMCSGIYNTSINFGFWLTPLLSGLISNYKGYQFTCDFMAFLSLGFGLIFYIVIVKNAKQKRSINRYSKV